MARRTRSSKVELSESWGILDNEESDGSSTASLPSSSLDEISPPAIQPSSKRQPDPVRRRSSRTTSLHLSNPGNQPVRRTTRCSSSRAASTEPEMSFIMPSMPTSTMNSPAKASPKSATKLSTTMQQSSPSRPGRGFRKVPTKSKINATEKESYVSLVWERLISPLLGYVFGVAKGTLHHLQPFISAGLAILVFLWLVRYLFQYLATSSLSFVPSSIGSILSPCSLPIVSLLPFCNHRDVPQGRAEFDRLVDVQSSLVSVLDKSAQGVSLPMDMKQSEASVRDLRRVVEFSSLPSKNEIKFELDEFVGLAGTTSRDLISFNSHIGRAVDRVIAMNRHTLQVLDGFAQRDRAAGVFSGLWTSLMPFHSGQLSDADLVEQYLKHADRIESEIQILIQEGQALLIGLERLQSRLHVIGDIAYRDQLKLRGDQHQLLAQLWTKLGGNKMASDKLQREIYLVNGIEKTRQTAVTVVALTVNELQVIAHNIEDLRERVKMPATVGTDIPLEQHIHIIQMGVDRLQDRRLEARKEEDQRIRAVLDKGKRFSLEGPPAIDAMI